MKAAPRQDDPLRCFDTAPTGQLARRVLNLPNSGLFGAIRYQTSGWLLLGRGSDPRSRARRLMPTELEMNMAEELLSPEIRGPLSECSMAVVVAGQVSGSTVTVFQDGSTLDSAFSAGPSVAVPLRRSLAPNLPVTAVQEFEGNTSAPSPVPVFVQPFTGSGRVSLAAPMRGTHRSSASKTSSSTRTCRSRVGSAGQVTRRTTGRGSTTSAPAWTPPSPISLAPRRPGSLERRPR